MSHPQKSTVTPHRAWTSRCVRQPGGPSPVKVTPGATTSVLDDEVTIVLDTGGVDEGSESTSVPWAVEDSVDVSMTTDEASGVTSDGPVDRVTFSQEVGHEGVVTHSGHRVAVPPPGYSSHSRGTVMPLVTHTIVAVVGKQEDFVAQGEEVF
jgi:hypothetical protein